MTTIDMLAVVGALCSLLMVGGSLYLLNKGVVTLREANPNEAIKVEFRRVLNFQTKYPALALFAFGIIFLGVSFWFAANAVHPVIIRGHLEGGELDNATITFAQFLGNTIPNDRGDVSQELWPKLYQVQVEVVLPGHETKKALAVVDKDQNNLSFGTVRPGKKLREAPPTDSRQIEAQLK